MKVLCIGDVCGENGCKHIRRVLPKFKRENGVDFVIVNGENSFDGKGITPATAQSIFDSGADVITTGNHAFGRYESYEYYESCENLIRPANYPKGTPGRGYTVIDMLRYKVCVINMLGTMYLEPLEDPFQQIDDILKQTKDCKIRILDFHAEATAEKIAFANYVDGRASIVFGTHTHVQTADECCLPNGTAYITDIGMTGTIDSVIGMDKQASIKRFVTTLPEKYKLAEGECKLNSCLFELDDETCRTNKIQRINL